MTWLDVPKQMRKHQSVAYKTINVQRDTKFGINTGSPAFLLDDPDGDSWCMKSASLIVDPSQTYESLKDLGRRLPWGVMHFRPESMGTFAGDYVGTRERGVRPFRRVGRPGHPDR